MISIQLYNAGTRIATAPYRKRSPHVKGSNAMNFTHLRAFHAVASEGSFTRAAQILNVSQPTLSSQVKSIEEAYGVRLLDRRNRKIVPSDIGSNVLELCREVFRLQDELEAVLEQSRKLQAGSLKVGADGPRHIMPVVDAFMRLHPKVTVSLTTGNAKKTLENLLNYETDVAIVALPKRHDARLHMVPFCTYPQVAFVSRNHHWSSRHKITLADFHGERLIIREPTSMTRQILMRALANARVRPSALIEIDNREASREAVALGIGVGVMSSTEFPSPDTRCVALPIDGPGMEITEYVACLENRHNLRAVREFFRVAEQCKPVTRPRRQRVLESAQRSR
jgi:aminoethylphosphonate catabolism LysR family transcriptional regulator